MEAQSATQVLGQVLLVSLLVERIMSVGEKLVASKASIAAEDSLDPQPDPWDSWSKAQVVIAFLIAVMICYLYHLDFFSQLFPSKTQDAKVPDADLRNPLTHVGYFLSSVVIAGGSGGIQKILAAISASAKSAKAEARARLTEARARMIVASRIS
jgi:hypothetical protein